jgi:surface polysaccharide O-acyltransferase-like enzyme
MEQHNAATQVRNQSVDTFRLLAALSVIILHLDYSNLPREFGVGIRLLSRWAIPFFFIVSGYFFASRNPEGKRLNVQAVVERLLWIFLLWNIIYAPVVIDQHDVTTLLKRLFSLAFLYFGDFVHLWFVPALFSSYLFVAFCHNSGLRRGLPVFSALFIVLALISTSYSVSIKPWFSFEFDFTYWMSIPFLYLGFHFFRRGHPSWWMSAILIVGGAGLQILEARFLYDEYAVSAYDHEFLVGTIPFAIGMAGLALNDLRWSRYPVLSNWGRDYSLGITPSLAGHPVWQAAMPLSILALCLAILGGIRRYLPGLFAFLNGRQRPA